MSHDVILQRVEGALADLKTGKMIIVTDDAHRENEADIVISAEFISEQSTNFMLQHCSGIARRFNHRQAAFDERDRRDCLFDAILPSGNL